MKSDLKREWVREERGFLSDDWRRLVGCAGLEELEEIELRRLELHFGSRH